MLSHEGGGLNILHAAATRDIRYVNSYNTIVLLSCIYSFSNYPPSMLTLADSIYARNHEQKAGCQWSLKTVGCVHTNQLLTFFLW